MKIIIKLKGSTASRICRDVDDVFDCVMAITSNNIEIAMNVQGWSDLAVDGETYDGDTFTAICECE